MSFLHLQSIAVAQNSFQDQLSEESIWKIGNQHKIDHFTNVKALTFWKYSYFIYILKDKNE